MSTEIESFEIFLRFKNILNKKYRTGTNKNSV